MTLAIGDGANDVAMIQEAHIGVGIAGLEGAQASMSADYALGQFRFLTKLLLVHGRWCYIRIADMHANFFFKNIIWTLVLFWYQIYCSFNGSYVFEYTFIMLFNLVFTSLPVGLMGAFEQDLSANASMAFPALYKRGIYGLQYTRWKFWLYMLDGTYQSIVSFWVPYFVYFNSTTASVTGRDTSIWEFGATVACGTVFAANNLIGINTRYFPWFIAIVLTLSSTLVLVWTALYSGLADFYFKDVVLYTFSTIEFWASFILVQVLSLLPRAVYKYLQIQYWPRDSDIIREIIIGKSYQHQAGHPAGLEEDVKQLKLIEQVIEKDKSDRLESERSSTRKKIPPSGPSNFSSKSSSSPISAPLSSGTRGATMPTAAVTTPGRSTSMNRKILTKPYQGTDSVEMTAVQPDYPISGVPSITTTNPNGDESMRVTMDRHDHRDSIGYYVDHPPTSILNRHGSFSSNSNPYLGLASSSPGPSPKERRYPQQQASDEPSSIGSSSQHGHHQADRFELDYEGLASHLPELGEPPMSAQSGWMSEEFKSCHSHAPPASDDLHHRHRPPGPVSGSIDLMSSLDSRPIYDPSPTHLSSSTTPYTHLTSSSSSSSLSTSHYPISISSNLTPSPFLNPQAHPSSRSSPSAQPKERSFR